MKLPIEKLARALDLPATTIERWVRQGRIPVQKRGAVCVFHRPAIEKWAATHHLPFAVPEDAGTADMERAPITLLAAMQRGAVYHNVTGDSVETVLKSAVRSVTFLDESQKDFLFEQLLERERLTSTGIGRGVAIPHPRSPLPEAIKSPAIVTCFLENEIDFNAVDDLPVFALFILMSTEVKIHLQLLSRLSFCLRKDSFNRFLRERPSEEAFFKKIADFEKRLDAAER